MSDAAVNLYGGLAETAARAGQSTAFEDPAGPMSFAQLLGRSAALGALIGRATDKRHVALYLPSSTAFAAAFYGILAAGRTALPLNLLIGRDVLEFIVRDADVDLILTLGALKDRVDGLAPSVVALDELSPGAAEEATAWRDAPAEQAVLLYTSGTTANPKGVPLTHANIASNLTSFDEAFDFSRDDVFLCVLPMFHTFALTTNLVLPVTLGARTVCMPRFQPAQALKLIAAHGVTAVMSIASMYRLLLHAFPDAGADVSSVRLWVAGGEPLPAELTSRFERLFGARLLEGYGLTEASPVVCVNRPDLHRSGTAGTALPGVWVQTVDEAGSPVEAGAEGELWVRGGNVMSGYYNRPEESRETLTPEGWLRTGDMAVIDPDGFVKITGRKKELIIISGENVSPVEIESVLLGHEAVLEAAAVPVPDASRGEVPVACVALIEGAQATEAELRRHCRQTLPPYKVPRRIHILPELPHGPTGKVLRRSCREIAEAASESGAS